MAAMSAAERHIETPPTTEQAGLPTSRRTPNTAHTAMTTPGRQPHVAMRCYMALFEGAIRAIPRSLGENHTC